MSSENIEKVRDKKTASAKDNINTIARSRSRSGHKSKSKLKSQPYYGIENSKSKNIDVISMPVQVAKSSGNNIYLISNCGTKQASNNHNQKVVKELKKAHSELKKQRKELNDLKNKLKKVKKLMMNMKKV